MTVVQIIAAASVMVVVGALVYLVVIHFRHEQYTREKFAFVGLTGFLGMATGVLVSLEDKQTPFGEILNLVREILGLPVKAEPARIVDHILMLLVLILASGFILRVYESWGGQSVLGNTRSSDTTNQLPLSSKVWLKRKGY